MKIEPVIQSEVSQKEKYKYHILTHTYGILNDGDGLVAKSCPTLATPWTVACKVPLSMGFSRQEYGIWKQKFKVALKTFLYAHGGM